MQCDVQSVIPTIKLKSAHGRFEFYGRGDRNVIPIRLTANGPLSLRMPCMLVPNHGSILPLRGNKIIMPPTATFLFYGRGDRNRTCDPLHPMQVLYQAELRPDDRCHDNINFHNLQTYKFLLARHHYPTGLRRSTPFAKRRGLKKTAEAVFFLYYCR